MYLLVIIPHYKGRGEEWILHSFPTSAIIRPAGQGQTPDFKKVAEKNILTARDASIIIDCVLNIIMDTVASGEEVQLFGFGSFSVKHRDERQGRNPATGEAMTIAASNTPVFKAAKAFKDKV